MFRFPQIRLNCRLTSFALFLLVSIPVAVPVFAQSDEPPVLIFPVVQGAQWSDTFGAPRSGHTHQGQDLMAPKLRPLVACFAGTVTIHRNHGTAGNWITLTGTGDSIGWRAEYMHLNNDTPGTNDNAGGDTYAFAPGLKDGDAVSAGQFLGYVGNSGNAETTGSHCHFELHGPHGVIDAAAALHSAKVVSELGSGITTLPVQSSKSGPLEVVGTVLQTFPDQAEAIVKVTSITPYGGSAISLRPPRAKLLIFRNGPAPANLTTGTLLTAVGADGGRGKPLRVARVSIFGVETIFPATNSAASPNDVAQDGGNGAAATAVPAPVPAAPAPALLPERYTLDGFESGDYAGWKLSGNCWGSGPERTDGRGSFLRNPGGVGRFFASTARPRLGDSYPSSGTGVALSPEFPLTYRKLRFLIGGGSYPGECCLNLRIGDQIVRTATGDGTDRLSPVEWDISEFVGKRARLEIVDNRVFGQRAYVLLDEIAMVDPVQPEIPAGPAPIEPAVPETVAPTLPAPPLAAPSTTALVTEDGAPHAFILLQDGTRVEGARLLTLEATGYGPEDNGPWSDRTALGTRVGFGTVAVDPRVIPLHRHLWVEGYGFCIALDTGGAIKGMKIDLGQETEAEAQAVGRQKRRVLVLD